MKFNVLQQHKLASVRHASTRHVRNMHVRGRVRSEKGSTSYDRGMLTREQ